MCVRVCVRACVRACVVMKGVSERINAGRLFYNAPNRVTAEEHVTILHV